MRSSFSSTVTSWPARASCCAAARPAGPEPTTATLLAALTRRAIDGHDEPAPERAIDDAALDRLDGHRLLRRG